MNRALPGSCGRVRARLEQLVDGALAPLEEARDTGHMEACDGCRTEEARWRELVRAIRSASACDPEELALALGELRARIDAGSGRARSRRSLVRGVPAALLASAAALLALFALEASGLWPRPQLSRPRVPAGLGRVELRLPVWAELTDAGGSR